MKRKFLFLLLVTMCILIPLQSRGSAMECCVQKTAEYNYDSGNRWTRDLTWKSVEYLGVGQALISHSLELIIDCQVLTSTTQTSCLVGNSEIRQTKDIVDHTGKVIVKLPNSGSVNFKVNTDRVSCDKYALCLSKVGKIDDGGINFSTTIPTNGIPAGETQSFAVMGTRSRDGANFSLKCLNCSEIPGVTQVGGSGWSVAGNIAQSMQIQFDTSIYLNTKKTVSGEIEKVKFIFFAEADVVNPPKYGYKEVEVTIAKTNCSNLEKAQCGGNKFCVWYEPDKQCFNATTPATCPKIQVKEVCGGDKLKDTCAWNDESNKCLTKNEQNVNDYISAEHQVPDGYVERGGILPPCAFDGSCRDINKFVEMVINIGSYVFQVVAGLTFVMFVYGGFTWVLSFGNSERVKKGQQIIVAAVVGLVIVFSAYLLVTFLLDALGVKETFRGI